MNISTCACCVLACGVVSRSLPLGPFAPRPFCHPGTRLCRERAGECERLVFALQPWSWTLCRALHGGRSDGRSSGHLGSRDQGPAPLPGGTRQDGDEPEVSSAARHGTGAVSGKGERPRLGTYDHSYLPTTCQLVSIQPLPRIQLARLECYPVGSKPTRRRRTLAHYSIRCTCRECPV